MSVEDLAQDIELKQYEINNRPPVGPYRYAPDEPGYGPEECEDCGDTMPVERRVWGYTLCVPCKQLTEPPRRL